MLNSDLMRRIKRLDKRIGRIEPKPPGAAGYAQGTFVPTYLGATTVGVTTYTTQVGFYRQFGPVVFFSLRVIWTAATGTGIALISLPFTSDATTNMRYTFALRTDGVTFANNNIVGRLDPANNQFQINSLLTNAAPTAVNVEAAGDIIASGFYFTSSGGSGGGGGSTLTVEEQDGTPTVSPVTKIKVSNGTLTDDGGGTVSIAIGTGTGTVTSVAMTVPAEFAIAGSPITTSGTLAVTKANENANTVWAGPSSGAAAAPTFRALVMADMLDALQLGASGVLFDHFLNIPPQSSQGNAALGLLQNASGSSAAVATVATTDTASIGIIDCNTGVATNGRAGVFSFASGIRFGGGVLDLTWRFQVVTLPTGGEDYDLTIGFLDAVNSSHTDGAYLFLSSASANFRYFTRQNGAGNTTNTDSGLAAVAGTWYKLRIVVNAAASAVTFTIDGANSQSPTTNIPTGAGREVGIGAGITKTAGTTARHAYLDYTRFAWSSVNA